MKNPTATGLLIAGSVAGAAVWLLTMLCINSHKKAKKEVVQP